MTALIDALDNWSSLGGLGVSIVGFGMTLWLLVRSKTAADAAREAAAQAVDGIRTVRWLVDFSSIHHDLEKAKVLMRQGSVDGLPEKFSGLRRHLIRARAVVREEGGLGERELHEAIKFLQYDGTEVRKGPCRNDARRGDGSGPRSTERSDRQAHRTHGQGPNEARTRE